MRLRVFLLFVLGFGWFGEGRHRLGKGVARGARVWGGLRGG